MTSFSWLCHWPLAKQNAVEIWKRINFFFRFSNSSGLKSDFQKFRFCDTLVWTEGLTGEKQFRFKISSALVDGVWPIWKTKRKTSKLYRLVSPEPITDAMLTFQPISGKIKQNASDVSRAWHRFPRLLLITCFCLTPLIGWLDYYITCSRAS